MPIVTSIATYRRLLDKLLSIEAKLSPPERSALHSLLPRDMLKPNGTSIEFLFAAPHEILSSRVSWRSFCDCGIERCRFCRAMCVTVRRWC